MVFLLYLQTPYDVINYVIRHPPSKDENGGHAVEKNTLQFKTANLWKLRGKGTCKRALQQVGTKESKAATTDAQHLTLWEELE